jgi:hypothetical protein
VRTKGRLDFINKNQRDEEDISIPDKLRMISTTKVKDTNEFDKLFHNAIEKQLKRKAEEEKKKQPTEVKLTVVKDDIFEDLDKELGL